MKWTKNILTGLALTLAATQFAQAATEVKVGMSGHYFPFTFVKQDKLQGFEVDLWGVFFALALALVLANLRVFKVLVLNQLSQL